jgi:AraC family transcriptional regulator
MMRATTTAKKIRVLNLHLTASVFTQLGDCYGLPAALDRSVRYVCGEQDEVVNQINSATDISPTLEDEATRS